MNHELTLKDKDDFLQPGKDVNGKSTFDFIFPERVSLTVDVWNGQMSQDAASQTVKSHQ